MPDPSPVFVGKEVGEPLQVGEVRLTPVVRVVRLLWRRRMVSDRVESLKVLGLFLASPIAVRVLDSRGERTLAVPNPSLVAWLAFLAGLVLMPFVSRSVVDLLVRRDREGFDGV